VAVKSSGSSLAVSEIVTEFGGSTPHSLSEYYAGGSNVPSGTTGEGGAIPTSGAISIGQFYGSTNRVAISLNTGVTTDYNIFDNRGGTYVAGASDITVTVDGRVGSTSTSTPALDTGSGWTSGDTITIIVNAFILGKGGAGGNGGNATASSASAGSAGGAGGTALNLQYDVTIDQNSEINGGGGGGGGGGGASGIRQVGFSQLRVVSGGGGGGGGTGKTQSSGGNGGTASGATNSSENKDGSSGSASSQTAGGSGGSGGSTSGAPAGDGGNGGGKGAAGSAGDAGSGATAAGAGGAGGAAGKAIALNGNTATFVGGDQGTINGAIS
jgi:hypothetical protein